MAPRVVAHPGAQPTNRLEAPCGRPQCKGCDPFDYAASRRQDDAQDRERECFYCLSGGCSWVPSTTTAGRSSTPFAVASAAVRAG